jgi:outer membrane protein OmpA-like peptidoglycan-associated protein
MLRLSAGVVFHIGSFAPPVPVALACSVNPVSIFPGDPVTVTATAENLDPKLHVVYSWSGEAVTGDGTTVTVATATLAPGIHTVNGKVSEGKGEKIGLKPGEVANCSASFTVKAFEPPTISCSASPNTIKPDESSTVTATGVSPQNRPLTYSYSAQSGSISGNGATATYSSTGAPAGPVGITCNVTDDKGNSAAAVASVTIAPAPAPPLPSPEQVRLEARLALHSVFFPTAQPRAEHPEGGLLESQQQTLKTLAEDFKGYLAIKPEAHLILTGHADVRGTPEYNQALTERRVNRAKQFLVEQGIAEGAIETRAVGKEQQLSQDQVKDLVQNNPDLTDSQRQRILHDLTTIVLAQNRRVDITLTTTGQQSVKLYPFNAEDSITLLDEKASASRKHAHTSTKHVHAKK